MSHPKPNEPLTVMSEREAKIRREWMRDPTHREMFAIVDALRERVQKAEEALAEAKKQRRDLTDQKKVIGDALYEIHSMMVPDPLEADNARTFQNCLHEMRVEAEKILENRQRLAQVERVARALRDALVEAGGVVKLIGPGWTWNHLGSTVVLTGTAELLSRITVLLPRATALLGEPPAKPSPIDEPALFCGACRTTVTPAAFDGAGGQCPVCGNGTMQELPASAGESK